MNIEAALLGLKTTGPELIMIFSFTPKNARNWRKMNKLLLHPCFFRWFIYRNQWILIHILRFNRFLWFFSADGCTLTPHKLGQAIFSNHRDFAKTFSNKHFQAQAAQKVVLSEINWIIQLYFIFQQQHPSAAIKRYSSFSPTSMIFNFL